jgi:thiamine-phosphate pyrophosphorylase
MKLDLSKPILYLITRGASSEATTTDSPEYQKILDQVSAAVTAGIDLIQIREKRMTTRILFALTEQAAKLTRGSGTQLLVNDRADVAASAGADGVHLTTQSIDPQTIRRIFGKEFLVGVSTHSLPEARNARDDGAHFVVFGPVFPTASKEKYGAPVGVAEMERVAGELRPFPVLALGGITSDNTAECLHAGASGIAGISLFDDPSRLREVVTKIRE